MSLAPGRSLGPYEILALLGAGGMGEVWRARDTKLGRDVAIKALPAALAQDAERLARFKREAQLLASLNHPNIAAIYGLEDAGGTPFLVLELVDGEDLAERLKRGAIPLDETLAIGGQIAEALEEAHEKGIVHRDLKPANVKLTPDGKVKVLDFGLAKAYASEAASGSSVERANSPTMTHAATSAGMILGTAAYMSPEQARGKSVDKRSDIWSFGCVLYECLTARPLFEGDTISDLIAKILQTEPDWSGLPASTPPRVRTLLLRCLKKDTKERLRDIGEARIALSSPGDATPAPAPATPSRGVPWWAAVAGALVLAVIAVLATLRLGPSTVTPPLRKLDLTASDVEVAWNHAPILSPDGARIAYVSKNRIWIRDLSQLAPRAVADVSSATPIGWSHDSRALVFADAKKLWKVPVEGGNPIAICEIPGTGNIIGATWSRSGVVALAVWRGGLYTVPASGGAAKLLIDIDPATTVDFHAPSWLANGDLLYVTHWSSEHDASGRSRAPLTIFDGKQQIPVVDDFRGGTDFSAIVAPTGELLFLRGDPNPGLWSARFDMTRRRVDGTPVLVAPGAVSVSVAADGSLLYVEGSGSDEGRELVWVDRSGKVIEVLGSGHAGLAGATLSPDGRRVAFGAEDGGNPDIWVRDLARGTETRLTFSGDWEVRPEWLASSSRLGYIQAKDLEGRIVAVNADGSGGQREFAPMAGLGAAAAGFSVASDGKRAVRIVDERGIGRLRVGPVLPDGSLGDLRPILKLEPEPDIQDARISPDGKLLAYVTNDPRRAVDLFLTRFPDGVGQWQVGTEGGRTPRWARDSGELFFIAGSGPSRRAMVSVKVDSAQDPPLGEAARLFELGGGGELDMADANRFDVTADGQRFLFVRAAGRNGGTPQRMVLVQNWRAELEKDGAR